MHVRFTDSSGTILRSLLAFSLTSVVLIASAFLLGVMAATGLLVVFATLSEFVPVLGSTFFDWADWIGDRLLVLVGAAMLFSFPFFLLVIIHTIRQERRASLEGTAPVSEVDTETAKSIDAATTRLAKQFDVSKPQVRFHPSSARFAYTTYRPNGPVVAIRRKGSPVVVVSNGLVRALSPRENEAILAHEFAHLSNDDLQLTSWLLVPLFAAEFHYTDANEKTSDSPLGWLLMSLAAVGVGVFSRGRELAAAVATGDPSVLATALKRLHETESRPSTDLRVRTQSRSAISIVPIGDDRGLGLRSTHPSPDTRLAVLRSLVAAE